MIIDKILDKSIYFSFDQTGHERHSKSFHAIDYNTIKGKTFVVTGGTSGIGYSISKTLLASDASLIFTGRTLKEESLKNSFKKLDLTNHQETLDFAKELPVLHGIVLNAGGMPPVYEEFNGYEAQFSSQVLGHYILVRSLIDQKKLGSNSNVVWMSSGGMYMVKYNEDLITQAKEKYDKVNFYANAKRAQIILNDFLHENYHHLGINFSVMHPGWVDTPGVRDAIPGFFNFTKNRLRTPEQGADTAIWLLSQDNVSSGEFWFDRMPQKKVVFPWTNNSPDQRNKLYERCEQYYQEICQS